VGSRGSLRIYLGAAPGVGKTYKMLGEAVRRKERGTDVVIGLVETHGRSQTAGQIADLEVIPLKPIEYRGTTLHEMDVDAILARKPKVVLVDEYAHTNAPGSRNEKRWQDVEQLLDAGIDVISTLNIQHLESLNDVISRITGIVQRETVPDDVVRRADQIELVDMSPEAIRRRLAHGNIYPPERIDAALANYFRPGNLSGLRELALLWVADRVEESLHNYLDAHGIAESWETRERVVVGITGVPGGDALIRRAARMAGRVGGELIGVHVAIDDGLTGDDAESLSAQRRLVTELGGTVHDIVGHDTAESLAAFARREKATQLVLGASRRSRWHELLHGSFVARITRLAGDIDVHVIANRADDGAPSPPRRAAPDTDRRRAITAWVMTLVGLPLLVVIGESIRAHLALSTVFLIALAVVLAIAAIGGKVVGVVAAVVASLLVNWTFVPPYYTLTISEGENVISLVIFVAVAIGVGSLVDLASRRAREARRARLEAEALARSTSSLAADPDPLPGLVEQIGVTFDLAGVQITREGAMGPVVVALSGDVTGSPTASLPLYSSVHGQAQVPVATLQVFGRALSVDDHRLLRVLADQLAVALDNQRLAAEASEAAALADIDAVRTAMLRAVSHDLRTPLASIKAMISGLRDSSVQWTPEQIDEALVTVDEETDRLNRVVGNLLDASRLQIGALAVEIHPMVLADTVASALQSVNVEPDRLEVSIPHGLPLVLGDPTLLERSLANVISNAVRYSPAGVPVRVEAALVGDEVHLRVVDRGPGVPGTERARVLSPFQRLGDQRTSDGVGLGFSIAQGFVTAMHGSLTLDDTPGGGLTVTIVLPKAAEVAA
jgi:two-component system, OmpR family, sensor histidine kinase KdpD